MTAISNKDIACACCLVLKGKTPTEQSAIFKKIVQFLIRKRLLPRSSGILSELNEILNEEDGRVVVKIKSAKKINEKERGELVKFLKRRYSAKEIILNESLDESLLGGVRIEANNEIIDLSIKNKITKLKEHLIKSA